MNGKIKIIRNDNKITNEGQKSDLQILYKWKNIEVMHQFVKKNSCVWLEPATDINTIEFFYLVSGSIEIIIDGESNYLSLGDSFVVQNISENILVKVNEDSCLLYFTNGNLYEELNDFNEKLDTIMDTIEEKDSYTKTHCSHVAHLCDQIYENLPLEKKETCKRDKLILAAIFHDVGNTYLPDEIIHFKGQFSDKEYIIVKEHVKNGYNLIQPLYGAEIADMVLYHHERLDGSGYHGLKGDEISVADRIIAVCDAFDAMTSKRTYKKTFTHLEAINELLSLNDKYDIEIVNILKYLLESNKIFKEYLN